LSQKAGQPHFGPCGRHNSDQNGPLLGGVADKARARFFVISHAVGKIQAGNVDTRSH